jgi:hypothetical protein
MASHRGLFISSPHDVEARYAKEGTTSWVGYKVHLTETCEDDAPHLIVHLATTEATAADGDVTPVAPEALRGADLLPSRAGTSPHPSPQPHETGVTVQGLEKDATFYPLALVDSVLYPPRP